MNEDELKKKREEFRNEEVQRKIEDFGSFGSAEEYRQHTLKINYTKKKIKIKLGFFGLFFLLGQATFLLFFTSLLFISYIPKTKFIVTKIFP